MIACLPFVIEVCQVYLLIFFLQAASAGFTLAFYEADRGAAFAAQFALSLARWLVTYPLAGWVAASAGMGTAALTLAAIGALGLIAVLRIWPADDKSILPHDHPDLPPDHPHMAEGHVDGHGAAHRHAVMIDPLHPNWPRRTA